MAIRIRCSDCRKKISIDEAFAGGMCRCPYCKAIVLVSDKAGRTRDAARPAAPSSRPETPVERVEAAERATAVKAAEPEEVPMADPVRLQSIVTMVLLGLLLVMVVAAVVLFIKLMPGGPDEGQIDIAEVPVNPFMPSTAGPAIAGISIAPPVIYIIDSGSSMREMFDYAVRITWVSISSLRAEQQYSIVLAAAGANKFMPGGYVGGGRAGEAAAREFLVNVQRMGASDIPKALSEALGRKPKTIILYARKPMDNAIETAKQAKADGVKIITIALDSDAGVRKSMAKLAETTGAEKRSYSFSQLQCDIQQAPPLD